MNRLYVSGLCWIYPALAKFRYIVKLKVLFNGVLDGASTRMGLFMEKFWLPSTLCPIILAVQVSYYIGERSCDKYQWWAQSRQCSRIHYFEQVIKWWLGWWLVNNWSMTQLNYFQEHDCFLCCLWQFCNVAWVYVLWYLKFFLPYKNQKLHPRLINPYILLL